MGKILFWLVVVGVVVLLMRLAAKKRVPPPDGGRKKEVEDMVRCRVCGVNLPRSEAILSRGRFYCSQEHRNQDQA